jgi:hypothetical protein
MYHLRDNLFFGRRDDGSVRLLKLRPETRVVDYPRADDEGPLVPPAEFDVVISPEEWASICASVSKAGETTDTYQLARALHNS